LSHRFVRVRFDRKGGRSLKPGPIISVLVLIGLVIGGLEGYAYLHRHEMLPGWLGGPVEKSISYEQLGPTPTASAVPTSEGAPLATLPGWDTVIDATALESRIHELVNAERGKEGLAELGWDADLAVVARAHSQDMAQRGYFAHLSPEGKGPLDRCKAAGFSVRKIPTGDFQYRLGCAENLFQGSIEKTRWYSGGTYTRSDYYTLEELAAQCVAGWMESPGHRENILTPYWLTEGIGIVIAPDGKVYVTQNFN